MRVVEGTQTISLLLKLTKTVCRLCKTCGIFRTKILNTINVFKRSSLKAKQYKNQ